MFISIQDYYKAPQCVLYRHREQVVEKWLSLNSGNIFIIARAHVHDNNEREQKANTESFRLKYFSVASSSSSIPQSLLFRCMFVGSLLYTHYTDDDAGIKEKGYSGRRHRRKKNKNLSMWDCY